MTPSDILISAAILGSVALGAWLYWRGRAAGVASVAHEQAAAVEQKADGAAQVARDVEVKAADARAAAELRQGVIRDINERLAKIHPK